MGESSRIGQAFSLTGRLFLQGQGFKDARGPAFLGGAPSKPDFPARTRH